MEINKIFKFTFILFVILEALSLLVFFNPLFNALIFLAIVLVTLVLSIKNLQYGLLIILTELFIGGKGYLFAINFGQTSISIRMGLFLAILGVWLYKEYIDRHNLISKYSSLIKKNGLLLTAYCLLLISIAYGIINGLLKNNFNLAYFDFNSWFFFALFLIFIQSINLDLLKKVTSILLASVTWVSLKTIIVLYLFSHRFVIIGDGFYKWLRDTGVGEITHIQDDIFRVFFQSHIFVLIGFFVLLTLFVYSIKDKQIFAKSKWSNQLFILTLFTILVSTTLLISQSRSFWVAGLVTFFGALIFYLFKLKLKRNIIIGLLVFILILGIFDSVAIWLITQSSSIELLMARSTEVTTEAASSSRINQLQPIFAEIKKAPLLGHGFGKTVTYKSADPRIVSQNPDGMYTTYAFEWGYLDTWLEIGLIGLLIYLILIGLLILYGLKLYKTSGHKTLILGLLLGLTSLVIANVFTPYLNHPLGIGYVLLLTALFQKEKRPDDIIMSPGQN
ncbi:O-antigen ligase family protein [Patescibacteria group bacterium]|nr:O-antigen ligase family protein [Patescibacteria group bacterium]